ncbi:MAG: hypothetical protein ACYTFI_01735, partial [Planctomycetota bacterium]
GLLFAYRLDFSIGPSVAFFLGLELALAGVYSLRPSRAYAFGAAVCLAAILVALLFVGPAGGTRPGLADRARTAARVTAPDSTSGALMRRADLHSHEAHAHPERHQTEDFELLVARADSADALARLFTEAPDEAARSDVIVRAFEVDRRTGVRLMLAFLRTGPPIFFRQVVVDKLEEVSGEPTGLDVAQPFSAAVNRAAAGKLAEDYGL